MRKSRAFPLSPAMAVIMFASILSATTTSAQEEKPAADTDVSAGSSEADTSSADTEADTESSESVASDLDTQNPADTAPAEDTAPAADTKLAANTDAAEVDIAGVDSRPETTVDAPAAPGLTLALGSADIRVRIYGFLNAQLEMAQAIGGTTPYALRGRVSDGNSRLGFSGNITLANGLQAIWQLEGGLANFEQGGVNDRGLFASIVSRNTFVGVTHAKAGHLIFGYNDSVYRSMVGSAGAFGGNAGLTTTGLDLWNNTTAQMSGNPDSLFGRGEARYANSLHYETPTFFGLQLGASYSFDESAELARFRNRFSAALTYEYAGFKIGGGYDYQMHTGIDQAALFEGRPFSAGAADDVTTSFAKGLVGYIHSRTKTSVAAGVEYARYGYTSFLNLEGNDVPPELVEGTMSQLGGMASASQGIGDTGLTVMVSGGMLWKLSDALIGSPVDYEAWQVSGGIKYMLGENFATYLYYTYISNSSRQNVNFGQAPVYSNNLGTSEAFLSPGNDPRALGIGVLARF